MNIRLSGAVSLTALAAILAGCASGPLSQYDDVEPAPELSPREVVEIQLTGLANDNADHEGIALAYRFAAPSNKAITGPLSNFISLFQQVRYRPMLEPAETEFLDTGVQRDIAYQMVRILAQDGTVYYYLFVLQRQDGGQFDECWMTAGVEVYVGEQPMVPDSI